MIKRLIAKMSAELKELIMGSVLLGVVFWMVFVWFFPAKILFSIGLWVGVLLAVFMAIHMNYSIVRMLEKPEGDSRGYMAKMVVIRMAVAVAVLFLMCLWNINAGFAVLLGMLTLKFGAYMQPHLHKMIQKKRKKGG